MKCDNQKKVKICQGQICDTKIKRILIHDMIWLFDIIYNVPKKLDKE